jgi:hypothetical protein
VVAAEDIRNTVPATLRGNYQYHVMEQVWPIGNIQSERNFIAGWGKTKIGFSIVAENVKGWAFLIG